MLSMIESKENQDQRKNHDKIRREQIKLVENNAVLSNIVSLVLAMLLLVSFVVYYFINWKYLSSVWPLS